MSTQAKHTPGPWRWEVNLKSKQVELCGGKPQFDLTVMGFSRWGMGGAKVEFLQREHGTGPILIEPCEKFVVPIAGREHHASWLQGLNHPDANLIAAAPDLLEALEEMLEGVDICTPDAPEPLPGSIIGKARAAVRKAKGEA